MGGLTEVVEEATEFCPFLGNQNALCLEVEYEAGVFNTGSGSIHSMAKRSAAAALLRPLMGRAPGAGF